MISRSYESSSASSEIVTPKGRKASRVSMAARNGKGAARLQKEKNGTIVKDDLVLFDKEGMNPEVAYFFNDELEKQGFTPTFALRNMGSAGVKGRIARGYTKTFGPSGVLNPDRMMRLNTAAQTAARPEILGLGPEFAVATAKGVTKAEVAKSVIPAIRKNPRIADALTFYEQNVPSHLFSSDYQSAVEKLGPLKNMFGL